MLAVDTIHPSGGGQRPVSGRDVRPWPLAAADPLALVVGGVFVVAASAGLFSAFGWSVDQIAQVQAGILMVAAAVRYLLERHNASRVVARMLSREATAYHEGLVRPVPDTTVHTFREPPGSGET